jgi:hypothetical protein
VLAFGNWPFRRVLRVAGVAARVDDPAASVGA